MQELLQHFIDAWSSPGDCWNPSKVIDKIESMIEKEKEHFIKAVNITEQEAVDFCNEQVKHYYDHEGMFGAVPEAGINYYNETYNDNE